jgi:uncharacterized coiled-coil DUF342 family protein
MDNLNKEDKRGRTHQEMEELREKARNDHDKIARLSNERDQYVNEINAQQRVAQAVENVQARHLTQGRGRGHWRGRGRGRGWR